MNYPLEKTEHESKYARMKTKATVIANPPSSRGTKYRHREGGTTEAICTENGKKIKRQGVMNYPIDKTEQENKHTRFGLIAFACFIALLVLLTVLQNW